RQDAAAPGPAKAGGGAFLWAARVPL
ncbi:MAG: hypothetical protein AVDCRST_MAG15-2116, partial [uncultured Rubellimicrobium sp.]